jgi:acetyl esterase/lipase
MVLCYPVISFGPFAHAGSRRNLLGNNPDPKLVELLSNELQVTRDTPPTFLYHTTADPVVPVENSVMFYSALRQAGVPAELHIYERGPHGVGLAQDDPVLSSWPGRLADWLRIHGWLSAK